MHQEERKKKADKTDGGFREDDDLRVTDRLFDGSWCLRCAFGLAEQHAPAVSPRFVPLIIRSLFATAAMHQ